ncbi:AAA family ATPase [Amycolatopsis lurida]|uniref:AAA family ATPase n=1 Tax=Amycolatopsis lurida TaxID=31959 RepID=UPI003667AA28
MTRQRLTSIEIEGFTSIRSARVELGAMNVLIGANGAGKSNFVHAFELLGRISEDLLNLFVGRNGGASALINDAADTLRISLKLEAPPNSYQAHLAAAPGALAPTITVMRPGGTARSSESMTVRSA